MASFPESGHVATANLPHAGRHVHGNPCVRAHTHCPKLHSHWCVDGSGAAFAVTFKLLASHDKSC